MPDSVFLEVICCVLVKPEVIPSGQVSLQIVFTCPGLNTDIRPTPGVAIVCSSLGGVTLPKRGALAGEVVRHNWAAEVQVLKHNLILQGFSERMSFSRCLLNSFINGLHR